LYLKSLELTGFKSFPDKTVMTFESGITAIVGPNGSGKSNIADAIRWVLGEQSTRKLRGGKMEDVIFGGTQKRGPVGFAQVSLTIDNADGALPIEHSEVMVTRRYYRSGESEYYINGASVRLKDLHEMFMDTGLGRDGYSIIGQGRIDEILSVKSSDRREIFEEAAGISKYRYRKEEAEHKLQFTEESLVRINDKIAEIELQIEPLREQSEKARHYLLLRDELRELEINVWMENWDKLREGAQKTRTDYETLLHDTEKAQENLNALYRQAEAAAESMHEKDTQAEQLRAALSAAENAAGELEGALAVLLNTLDNNEENVRRLQAELEEGSGRAEGLGAQMEARRARLEAIQAELSSVTAEIETQSALAAEAASSAQDNAKKIEGLRAQAQSAELDASEARAKIASLSASSAELYNRRENAARETESKKQQLEALSAQMDQARQKLNEAAEQKESVQNIIGGYKLRLDTRRQAADAAKDGRAKLELRMESLRSRIHMLNEMEKEYEGFSGAVKSVMQENRRHTLKNIHGPVSSLIKTEDRYALAAETALGFAMQNIVVDTEEDAKAAIEMLRRSQGGRATFLPLSAVRGSELSEPGLLQEQGVEGIASALVTYESRYADVIRNLLGRCVVIDNIDSAIRVARKYKYRFRIVTLDGQIINAGGSMTGGSTGRGTGILSRRNELKALSAELSQIETKRREAEEKAAAAEREASKVSYEIEVLFGQLREAEDNVLTLQTQKSHLQSSIQALLSDIESLQAETGDIDARIARNREEAETLDRLAAEKQAFAAQCSEKIGKLGLGQEDLSGKSTDLSEKISALRMKAAGLEAEQAESGKAMEELASLQADIHGDRQRRRELMEEYAVKNDEIRREMERKQNSLSALQAECGQKREALQRLIEQRLELEAVRSRVERESQECNRAMLDLERERARLEQKIQKAELEEKQIVDRLWEHYGMTHSGAQAQRAPVPNMPAAEKRIGQLKNEIGKLGDPNIGAIEEYKRVSERYDYLSSQRDDVEKSRTELLDIISEITTQMKEIFGEQFRIINESFSKTFVEIFGGGQAALELEDSEDILNCGIEIKVQPPGKQLKVITLLSGGEKAFVAIALYFAILKVRPTPFCVLDEIEAALDDINVTRYATFLRGMSNATQFIVITHRRGTMEEADTLYGITMQEQGVSKMLALHLSEVEQELRMKLT